MAEGVSLVVLLLTSYGIIAQLAPPVVAALFWRRATTPGVIAGLLAGGATTLFFFFSPELKPVEMHEGLFGLPRERAGAGRGLSCSRTAQDPARVEAYINPPAVAG